MNLYTVRVILEAQPGGGYTLTSPDLPELITEGDSIDEAFENFKDAVAAVRELYDEDGRPWPLAAANDSTASPRIEAVLVAA